MEMNFDFLDSEDFGLAKSFSRAPLCTIAPQINLQSKERDDVEKECSDILSSDYISDGFCFKLSPGENQVEFQRSLKEMAPKMTDFAKGTTTLAFEFKEGVLVAVDARATMGAFISSNNVRKVIEINDFLLGTMAGGAADCMFWEKYVAMQCRVYELRNGEKPSVAMASMMLASIMRQYRGYGLSMGTMFTGSDKTGASLYYIDNDATRLKGSLFAVGSGGTFAYGVLDTNYRYDMSLDDAVKLGIRAIASATFKDSASGGVVRIYHVTNNGVWNLIHDAIDVSDLHYEFEQGKGHSGSGREGEAFKDKFEGIMLNDAASESYFIRSNGVYTAIPWKTGGGGVLAVVKAYDYQRLEADLPLIKGHAGPVIDFEFSPFNDQLLATASEDGIIKLWIIPEEGITKDVTEADGELRGHAKKLIFTKFHPVADYTIASSGADSTIRIWDVTAQKNVLTYDEVKNVTTGLEWSQNGSLLGAISKDKLLNVFDPRKEGQAMTANTHEGARQQKVCWLGDSQTILTTGFSKISERQYAVWDLRDLSQPLIMKRLDDYAGIPVPFYDEDSKVVYIAGKGESSVSFYQFSTESPNYLNYLHAYKGKEPQKGFSFMPKRVVNFMENEIMRGVRLTGKTVEYVSFKVPRKAGTFSQDLYPPCKSGEAGLTFEEWWGGADKEPVRMEVKPTLEKHAVSQDRKKSFIAKLTGANAKDVILPGMSEAKKEDNNDAASREEIDALTQKIEQLSDQLQTSRQEVAELQTRCQQLEAENEGLRTQANTQQYNQEQQQEQHHEQHQEQQQEQYQEQHQAEDTTQQNWDQ